MTHTKQLAQFAVQLKYSDLPSSVIEKAKEIALHAWAVQLAGSTLPWSKAAYRYAQGQRSSGDCTVLNYGMKTSAVNAAFANGTFGHGFEMDDNHAATGIKGGCVVIPSAFAVGEQQLASGPEFILAIVAAYEVMLRVALSVTPSFKKRKGHHHPTGSCGTFAGAVAAGKLLRFNETTMLHALSVAAGHSAGLEEAPASGRGNLKRIFGGMAASSGIRSAILASEGLTGPATMLEGERGFCRTFGDTSNLEALTAGLGRDWEILRVHYKIYAQDGYIQPMTEGLERIVRQHGIAADDVKEIVVGTSRVAHEQVVGVIREPEDLTSAQFSANFSLALFLVKGSAGFQEYTEDSLADPKIVNLSRKIRTEVDEEIDAEWVRTRPRGARVTVRLNSGQVHVEYVPSLREMTADDVNQKFRRLASVIIDEERCSQLESLARNLDAVRDVSSLASFMVR